MKTKHELITKYLEITSRKTAEKGIQTTIDTLREQLYNISDKDLDEWASMTVETTLEITGAYLDQRFGQDEIEELITLAKLPVYQKALNMTLEMLSPAIVRKVTRVAAMKNPDNAIASAWLAQNEDATPRA